MRANQQLANTADQWEWVLRQPLNHQCRTSNLAQQQADNKHVNNMELIKLNLGNGLGRPSGLGSGFTLGYGSILQQKRSRMPQTQPSQQQQHTNTEGNNMWA
jgi:hypothetical protein